MTLPACRAGRRKSGASLPICFLLWTGGLAAVLTIWAITPIWPHIDLDRWNASFLLVIPLCITAWVYPRLAGVAILLAAVPQFILAILGAGSPGNEGLEILFYLWATVLTFTFVLAAAVGAFGLRRAAKVTPHGSRRGAHG